MSETTALAKARQEFESKITGLAPKFAEILPKKSGDPMAFVRSCIMATTRNPDLLAANRVTLYAAIANAAEIGLSVSGGPGGRAHLVPYGGQVTLIPDYKGLIELAYRSGKVATIAPIAVYRNDSFRLVYGTDSKIDHVPTMGERGDLIGTYAVATMTGGEKLFAFLHREEIDSIRAGSAGRNSKAWKDHFSEMAKKTAVRRLFKLLPITPEMEQAMEVDDAAGPIMPRRAVEWADVIPEGSLEAPAAEESPEIRASLITAINAARVSKPDQFKRAAADIGVTTLEAATVEDLRALEAAMKKGAAQ